MRGLRLTGRIKNPRSFPASPAFRLPSISPQKGSLFALFCACIAALAGFASARPGDLDLSFNPTGIGGTPGTVVMGLPDSWYVTVKSMVEMPDRKLIALVDNDGSGPDLIRWLPHGSPDPSFGTNGVKPVPLLQYTNPDSMAVQSDGRILIGSHGLDMRIIRLLPDGSPDLSFGASGVALLNDLGTFSAVALALSSDGKILAAGSTLADAPGVPAFPDVPRVWRLLPDGSPDLTFGIAGEFSLDRSYGDVRAIAGQPDGKVLITGSRQQSGSPPQLYLARCDAAGLLDPSFGFGGVKLQDGAIPSRLAVQPDGHIVVATEFLPSMALQRFTPSGTLDSTFNGTGITNFTPGSPSGLALQADGKWLIAGTSGEQMVALRYHADGTPDAGFGTGGVLDYSPPANLAIASGMILLADGRILIAGSTRASLNSSPERIMLVRCLSRDLPLAAESPPGSVFPHGGTVSFSVIKGTPAAPEFGITLRNTGNRPLTNLAAVFLGQDASSFEILSALPESLAPGGTAALTLRYLPSRGVSISTAALVIGSAVSGESFFTVRLQGAAELPVATLTLLENTGPITVNGTLDFGAALPSWPATRVLTVKNTGNIDLLLQGITLGPSGTPGDFSAGPVGTERLTPGASTACPVTFTPSGSGKRTARLRIASNDTFNPPFEITLSGTLANALETWRITHFGSSNNTGDAADFSDPDRDGIPNLIEFATVTDPLSSGPSFEELAIRGDVFEYTFMRPAGAGSVLSYNLQHADTVHASWRALPWVETILRDDGASQKVRITGTAFSPGRGFVRLMVSKR